MPPHQTRTQTFHNFQKLKKHSLPKTEKEKGHDHLSL